MNVLRALMLLWLMLLVACQSIAPVLIQTPVPEPSRLAGTPSQASSPPTEIVPSTPTRPLPGPSTLPTALTPAPQGAPDSTAPTVALSSFCATTPARPLPPEQLSLPWLPRGASVLLSVQQPNASCLVALDAQGSRVLEFPLAARGEWKWDARARILALRLLQDTPLNQGTLLWNRPFEQSETQRLAEAPEHGVFAFVFAPAGQQLAYLEVSPAPNAIAAWQLIRLDIATRHKETLITGSMHSLTPRATRPSADLLKSPVDWSAAANQIYLFGQTPGDSPPEGLWTIKPDGSDFRLLLSVDGFRGWVALAPDGRYLAYLAFDPRHPIEPRLADKTFWPPANQVRVMDMQSGAVTMLLTETEGGLLRPPFLWASDGRSLLLGHSPKGSAGIYAGDLLNVPTNGSGARVVRSFDDTREGVRDMTACPGGQLLYLLERVDEAHQIVMTDLQGATRTLLAFNPDRSAYVRVVGCFS
jgi:hypothetical protein